MEYKDLEKLKKRFSDYVAGYYNNDPEFNWTIRLKEKHTGRVVENIMMLGKAMNLSDEDMILAETMALFHDIGRFKQFAVYGTFKDMASENHALLGIRQLNAHNVLSVCTKKERRLITKAIACHNMAMVPENEDQRTLFYIRLLRDADKLDIWKVFLDYYKERKEKISSAVEIGLPDDPKCSESVIQALAQHRYARIKDLRTLNDFKLLQISWVFDLNFKHSFRKVCENAYIDLLEATITVNSQEITDAIQQARDYVLSRI